MKLNFLIVILFKCVFAPSAKLQDDENCQNIKKYFNQEIDFYKPVKLAYALNTFFAPYWRFQDKAKYVHICPADEGPMKRFLKKNSKSDCKILAKTIENNLTKCETKMKPTLYKYEDQNCGENSYYYSFRYNICNIEVRDILTLRSSDFTFKGSSSYDVFKFCFHNKRKQTLFTTHRISNEFPLKIQNDYETHTKYFDANCINEFKNLKKIAEAYKIEKQKKILLSIYKEEISDYLIPQMLIPINDVTLDLSRGVNLHYFNTAPQWKSISEIWTIVNEYIRELEQFELDKFVLHTGTSSVLKFNNEAVKIGEKIEILVPAYWWKLITNFQKRGIFIILHNERKGIFQIPKLCECTCDTNGLKEISNIRENEEVDVYCCHVTQKLRDEFRIPDFIQVEEILDFNNSLFSDSNLHSENSSSNNSVTLK